MAKKARVDPEFARYALAGIEAAIESMQRQAAKLRSIVGASAAGVRAVVGGARGGRPPGAVSRAREGSDDGPSSLADGPVDGRSRNDRSDTRRSRVMSPEARRRISEAQKARWAKQKGGAGTESQRAGAKRRTASGGGRRKKR